MLSDRRGPSTQHTVKEGGGCIHRCTYDASPKVIHALASQILDSAFVYVVEHAVYSEIPPKCILLRRPYVNLWNARVLRILLRPQVHKVQV